MSVGQISYYENVRFSLIKGAYKLRLLKLEFPQTWLYTHNGWRWNEKVENGTKITLKHVYNVYTNHWNQTDERRRLALEKVTHGCMWFKNIVQNYHIAYKLSQKLFCVAMSRDNKPKTA